MASREDRMYEAKQEQAMEYADYIAQHEADVANGSELEEAEHICGRFPDRFVGNCPACEQAAERAQ
jgi:hypothetical protein